MVYATCRVQCWCHFHLWELCLWGVHCRHPLEYIHCRCVHPGGGPQSMSGMHQMAVPSNVLNRGPYATHLAVLQPSGSMVGHTTLGTSQSPNPSTFFSRFDSTQWHGWILISVRHETWWFWCIDWISGWSVDLLLVSRSFVAWSHIYLGSQTRGHDLCISHLNKAVADFEESLDSILTDSIKTSELDTSFEEPDVITLSVSSGFPCSVSTISVTSKPQLAPRIKSHQLWCQARALLLPVPLAGKISASKLIQYFSVIQQHLGFGHFTAR